jgi:hypothetical protein
MKKLTTLTALCLAAFVTSAMADTKIWQVTEESESGIKNAQGTWKVTTEGDKISGNAELSGTDGSLMTYKIEGTVKDGVYTVNLVDRSDGKKGCVWTGQAPSASSVQTHGLIGRAPCSGAKMIIRASS